MNSKLIDAYRYHRYGKRSGVRHAVPAQQALEFARQDDANGKRRFPSSLSNPWNPRFAAYGESHLRWIENTDRAGLRFVGFADEIAGLRHKGWFADVFQADVHRGVVYQLPSRHHELVYVYGYDDPNNDHAALLSFDWTNDKHQAALWADRLAERSAEEAREYQEVSSQRLAYDDMAEEARGLRQKSLALIDDMKRGASTLANLPAARTALCENVKNMRRSCCRLYAKRADLFESYGHHDGWQI